MTIRSRPTAFVFVHRYLNKKQISHLRLKSSWALLMKKSSRESGTWSGQGQRAESGVARGSMNCSCLNEKPEPDDRRLIPDFEAWLCCSKSFLSPRSKVASNKDGESCSLVKNSGLERSMTSSPCDRGGKDRLTVRSSSAVNGTNGLKLSELKTSGGENFTVGLSWDSVSFCSLEILVLLLGRAESGRVCEACLIVALVSGARGFSTLPAKSAEVSGALEGLLKGTWELMNLLVSEISEGRVLGTFVFSTNSFRKVCQTFPSEPKTSSRLGAECSLGYTLVPSTVEMM